MDEARASVGRTVPNRSWAATTGTTRVDSAAARGQPQSTRPLVLLLAYWALPNAILVSLINIALPEIQREFDVSASALTWAASGYIISGAIGAVVYGKLIDTVGLRRIAWICLLGMGLMSFAVALAPSFPLLVALRIPHGLTGMALPAISLGGVLRVLPPHLNSRAVGWVMASFGLGLIIGSVVGGTVIEATNWRVPFALVGLLCLVGLVATLRIMPVQQAQVRRLGFDLGGGALITIAVGATLLAANQLPRASGVRLGTTAAFVAAVAWVAFLRQIRRSSNPFIDPGILRSRPFLRSSALGAMAQAQFVGAGFVIPLVLRNVYGYSVLEVGLMVSIGFLAVLAAGISATRLSDLFGAHVVLAGAVLLGALGSFGVTMFGIGRVALLPILYAMLGASYSTIQPVLLRAVGLLLPPEYIGAGMGFYNFTYFAGGAFAVALAGGVIERRIDARSTITRLHDGAGTEYVDGSLALLGFGIIAVLLLIWVARDLRGPVDGVHRTTHDVVAARASD